MSWILTPLLKGGYIFLVDKPGLERDLEKGIIITEGQKLDSGLFKALLGKGEPVGEHCHHTHNLGPGGTDSLGGLKAALTCLNQILDNNHLLADCKVAFDKVFQSVILGSGAYIYVR